MKDIPIKPTPRRIIVDGSATVILPAFSARTISGESNKPHNINAATFIFPFIHTPPLFLLYAKVMQTQGIVEIFLF
jgi:hypothetical protein